MTQIDVNSLLAQMRTLSAQLEPGAAAAPVVGDSKPTESFGNLLKQSIAEVAQTQNQAQQMSAAFDRGDPGTDLPQIMAECPTRILMVSAHADDRQIDLSFRAMTEVRNKLVSAYQDIMNMPL